MLHIITSSLRRKFTDRGVLINLVFLPVALVVILGYALSSTFTGSTSSGATTQHTSLVVVDHDQSQLSSALVTFVKGIDQVFTVTTSPDDATARALITDGKADVLVTVQSGYGAEIMAGGSGHVDLYAVDSRIDNLKAAGVALSSYSDVARTVGVLSPTRDAAVFKSGDYVAATGGAGDPSEGLSAMTYYAVTMLVLILVYGVASTMNFIADEYDGPLGDRYLISPTSKFALVAGQWVSGVVASLIQASVLVACAVGFFGVKIGAQWPEVLAIVVVASVVFTSLGLVLGLMGRTRPWLDQAVTVAIPILTFLGGGFVKIDFAGLESLSPNSWFQNQLFAALRAQPFDPLSVACAMGCGLTLLLVATLLLSRKEAR